MPTGCHGWDLSFTRSVSRDERVIYALLQYPVRRRTDKLAAFSHNDVRTSIRGINREGHIYAGRAA